MADLETYLTRIVDLANDLPEVGLASLTYPDESGDNISDNLPYVFVEDGEASYERINADFWQITREVRSLIYVSLISPETEAVETTGRVTDRTLLRVYTLQFMKRSRLQRNGSILDGIDSATITTDGGAQTADRKTKIYTALDIRHRIVYTEQVTEV